MEIYTKPLGPVQANCYVLIQNNHALVIDPGSSFSELDSLLGDTITLDAILLTHAHFDHIGGVDEIVKKYSVPVYLNPYEFDFLQDPSKNASQSFWRYEVCMATPRTIHEGKNQIGEFLVDAMYCPGHSIGSTVFIINNQLFTGDVLFQGSIGRTDLETGSGYAMMKSLGKLKAIQQDMKVYPGHGPQTTLAFEKKYNPYLQD